MRGKTLANFVYFSIHIFCKAPPKIQRRRTEVLGTKFSFYRTLGGGIRSQKDMGTRSHILSCSEIDLGL
jgi:hypothetical protein